MTGRWARLAACAALCTLAACKTEVTVHLLSGGTGSDADASPAAAPCQKLGAEVCNGGDDDCNGLVDEGCADTVVWTREADGVALGHETGGVMFVAPCPDGAVLTGMLVGMGQWLNQVVAVCRQIALHAASADAAAGPREVTLGARFDTSFAPAMSLDTANQVHPLLCPDGLVVSGVDGTTSTDPARYILGVRITCAPPVVTTAGSEAVLDVDRARAQTSDPVVCATCAATQAFTFSTAIDVGHVATRLFGGDGLWVDRVGFGVSLASVKTR